MAMVKLWERSAIAKIAIKRGVHNTCNERMAEELKVNMIIFFVLHMHVFFCEWVFMHVYIFASLCVCLLQF